MLDTILSSSHLLWLALTSCVAFLLFGFDKFRAKTGGRRIRERTLLGFAMIGGVFGAILGVIIFRHKKNSSLFWAVLGASMTVHVWLLSRSLPLQEILLSFFDRTQF